MPLSDRRFDKKIEEFLIAHPEKRYFDIGCGAGKYGKMLKAINPEVFVKGIEADSEYIEKYKTREIYDELTNDRIENFIRQKENLSFTTDIVIMGDLLEHLYKSDGIDLINFLIYRCKYMVIVFPSKFVMFDYKGHPSESHNSVWTENDFRDFDYEFYKDEIMNMVVVNGFWNDPETVYNLDKDISQK